MRLMYMDNPEDYLQTTGHLIKPLTPKSGKSEKSIDTKTKEHDMKVQDVKLMNEIETNGNVVHLIYTRSHLYFSVNY